MPELPEVEVTRLGIAPFLDQAKVEKVCIYQPKLRWMVSPQVQTCAGRQIIKLTRRAKYLLLHFDHGQLIFHLGMSGKMRVVDTHLPILKHDHVELHLHNRKKLVFNDPRRFGALLFQAQGEHLSQLQHLGPEPLEQEFTEDHLFVSSRQKTTPVKTFIMDNRIVVGVGNIYANEALFRANIHPLRAANRISQTRYRELRKQIITVLTNAITAGGTTLQDFARADGSPGYFSQQLNVYGRNGLPCINCHRPLKSKRIAQRNTFYCTQCQR